LIQAINARDYPLMMGGFILITVAMVIGITIADLTYGWLDPRAKGGGSRETY
jgi:peptide/nickel transport system permease protein